MGAEQDFRAGLIPGMSTRIVSRFVGKFLRSLSCRYSFDVAE
jgi:hypothetical protein